jgi:hypothetical protein
MILAQGQHVLRQVLNTATHISAIAVPPAAAYPIPKPAMPCSDKGVLKTRSFPNSSRKSTQARNTPPNATSSPNTQAVSSVAIAVFIALLIAKKRFIRSTGTPCGTSAEASVLSDARCDDTSDRPSLVVILEQVCIMSSSLCESENAYLSLLFPRLATILARLGGGWRRSVCTGRRLGRWSVAWGVCGLWVGWGWLLVVVVLVSFRACVCVCALRRTNELRVIEGGDE